MCAGGAAVLFALPPAPIHAYPIEYDAALATAGLTSPLLRVAGGVTPAWLLVDTGAATHTLAGWFVSERQIATAEIRGGDVRDATGRSVTVRSAPRFDVPLNNGDTIRLADALVADFPPMFQQRRIAGLVSPQLLGRPAALVDLRAPELRVGPWQLLVGELDQAHTASGRACKGTSNRRRLYRLPITLNGHSADMLVDTGANRTRLDEHSSIASGLRLDASGSADVGVAGVGAPATVAREVSAAIGSVRRAIDVRVGPAQSACGSDGIVGMDLLLACTLALAPDRMAISCRGE
jgi:Aspartyl protease